MYKENYSFGSGCDYKSTSNIADIVIHNPHHYQAVVMALEYLGFKWRGSGDQPLIATRLRVDANRKVIWEVNLIEKVNVGIYYDYPLWTIDNLYDRDFVKKHIKKGLYIGQHEVTFKTGYIKVGCQQISNDRVREIHNMLTD